ncbi:GntR family transcriptional regulator [Lactobacillus sp. DCY120]|uniref:GntR family transcriptional regulator n=1 Tax=Bombilactobacillus apium TaxID=2675299 RepID=A0A850RA61_9LACO|nr:GntR family transcriptional regulator [Bombilactobacillus apium]NVY96256.1 GntR family transcriptional regulator [Bombilactobacillus apium]
MVRRASSLTVRELVEQLIDDIRAGVVGDQEKKLPTELSLMQRYQVTRYTLRQALAQLSNLGYLYQAQGRGIFVRPQVEEYGMALQDWGGLAAAFQRQGKQLTTKTATITPILAGQAQFQPLKGLLEPTTPLWSVHRQRYLDGQPYLDERSYYLRDFVPKIPPEALFGSLFKFMQAQVPQALGFQDKVLTATIVTPELEKFFQLPIGSPVLTISDDSYFNSGQLIAFSSLNCDFRKTQLFLFKKLS